MSHRLVRRKEKVVYEEVPIIGVDNIEAESDTQELEDTSPTVNRVIIPDAPTSNRVITLDTVTHEGALEPLKRLANKYTVAPVITVKDYLVEDIGEEIKPESTKSAVIDVVNIVEEPINETISGYGKIFGSKKKKPIIGE